jgi:hypothetical protein
MTTSWARSRAPSLVRMRLTWVLQVSGLRNSRAAILATGLGAGILIDAVIVRCLLVPALVAVFGRANWWLPPWLAKLLRVTTTAAAPAPEGRPARALCLAAGVPDQ